MTTSAVGLVGLLVAAACSAATGQVSGLRPGAPDTNPYAQGLSLVLRHLGHKDANYVRVMGRSGMAFALQVDLAGPMRDGVYDVAWWPNDCWAFDMRLPFMARAFGRKLTKVAGDPARFRDDPDGQYRALFSDAVGTAVRAGRPVLAQRDAAWVITGVDATSGKPVGLWPSPGQPAFNADQEGYPWGVIVPGGGLRRLAARDADLDSLRWAVALGDDTAVSSVPRDYLARPDISVEPRNVLLTGRKAYAAWLGMLSSESGVGRDAWDRNIIYHLTINRRAAAAYLRDVASRQKAPAAARLLASAVLYDKVVQECGRAPFWDQYSDQPGQRPAKRKEYAEMVRRIAKLESEAVAEIRSALPEAAAPAHVSIPGIWMEQDSVALAVQAAAKLLGVQADYTQTASTLGSVFAPALDEAEDCASWWHCRGSMGTHTLMAAARAHGLRATKLEVAEDRRAEAVLAAVRRGAIVLSDGGWDAPGLWNMAGIVTDARLDGTVVGTPAFGEPGTFLRYHASLWAIEHRAQQATHRDPANVLRNALDRILGRGRYAPAGRRLYGLAALDRMSRQLCETPGYCGPCVSRGAKGWSDLPDNAKTIMGGALTAADYMEGLAQSGQVRARPHLSRAAALYRAIAARIRPLTDADALAAKPQDLAAQKRAAEEILVPVRQDLHAVADAIAAAIAERGARRGG